MNSETTATTFFTEFKNTHYGSNRFVMPSNFKDIVLSQKYNVANYYQTFYLLGCNDDKAIIVITNNATLNNITSARVIYFYRDYTYSFDNIGLSNSAIKTDFINIISDYGIRIFDSNLNLRNISSITRQLTYNQSYTDDFMNSYNPSEYIFTMFYIFIPILLFIFALKVFKNGLFRK